MKIVYREAGLLVALSLAAMVGFATAAQAQSKLESHYRLHRPEGAGPFPALMLVPGCSGIETSRFQRAEEMKKQGYAAIFVDYLSARGRRSSCKGEVPVKEIVRDIRDSAAYLKGRPFVDPSKVGIIGWSLGSGAILAAVADMPPDQAPPFHAAALFYPGCRSGRLWKVNLPVLMLLGGADDRSPPGPCQEMAKRLPEGYPIQVHVYPGAGHMFDGADLPLGRRNYDQQAAAQSWEEAGKFFARHLKGE